MTMVVSYLILFSPTPLGVQIIESLPAPQNLHMAFVEDRTRGLHRLAEANHALLAFAKLEPAEQKRCTVTFAEGIARNYYTKHLTVNEAYALGDELLKLELLTISQGKVLKLLRYSGPIFIQKGGQGQLQLNERHVQAGTEGILHLFVDPYTIKKAIRLAKQGYFVISPK